ncbi:DUF3263 domain-containing protein [Microbacterium sp. R1]|uniref:DUF3263 domain-containing protein n=1 Tax=Microbacterium phage vB_MoxS-R1 TaxID=2848881 RepID=A0A8F2E4M9_9CAUD|nr:DUF3263 domain-containing protein [Microbacterium sp. R1]YP_010649957.1 hypothetical protein PP419_gp36 [Microbacterium phage vB_MoxS-R1]MBE7953640.1 DUF3263 domain-containing protein [Microbacterium sp. R1]QWT28927.1 hypothetical protein vBMoxSR1_gp77 [Microbacterium phage vB_MoxS-R1]
MTPAVLLAFEARHPRHTPTKAARIRHELGITEVRYYVLLARAARSTEGIAADPTTARMIRERATRRAGERERRAA